MRTIEQRIAGVIAEHTWWLAGNLGVPGMPDWTTYKCNCGWNGDEPHVHVAAVVVETLGLTRENYVTQEIGVSPITLHNWERWATAWEEKP